MSTFHEALQQRRSYYALRPESPVSDTQIEETLRFALLHVPSAYNSQSTRLVLLLHNEHAAFWQIVLHTLEAITPADRFPRTRTKIENAFASGYGTVLFYEEEEVVQRLQRENPTYADNFPVWAQHTSAMHQLAIWTMLEELGFGASLQHYNPLIDKEVQKHWQLPASWRLIAQMPFGTPAEGPGEKSFEPIESRLRVFANLC